MSLFLSYSTVIVFRVSNFGVLDNSSAITSRAFQSEVSSFEQPEVQSSRSEHLSKFKASVSTSGFCPAYTLYPVPPAPGSPAGPPWT